MLSKLSLKKREEGKKMSAKGLAAQSVMILHCVSRTGFNVAQWQGERQVV